MQIGPDAFFVKLFGVRLVRGAQMRRKVEQDPAGRLRCVKHVLKINGSDEVIAEERYLRGAEPQFFWNEDLLLRRHFP
jgi:hypothetical protein